MADLPTVALSIQQPWAWLIVNGFKDIENRTWRTNRTGEVLIHAGQKLDREAHNDLISGCDPVTGGELDDEIFRAYVTAHKLVGAPRGGLVGAVVIDGCVNFDRSPWFVGPWGFVLRNARELPFRPLKGALGFFAADYAGITDRG